MAARGASRYNFGVEQRIVEFAEVLRQNGLKVSVGEVQDAARALEEVGLFERATTRVVLKATLCKRAGDVRAFDQAFDFFFSGASRLLDGLDRSMVARIEEEGLLGGDELEMIVAGLGAVALELSPLTQAAIGGDRAILARLFRGAALELDLSRLENPLQTGFYSRRLLARAGVEAMRGGFAVVSAELARRGVSPRGLEVVSRHLSQALRGIEDAARAEVKREANARIPPKAVGPADKPLAQLTSQELVVVKGAVRALAEKLKTRLVRRQRSLKRGHLNTRRTLRRNLSAGGVPMVPVFRRRRPERPDVIVLCDVSDSVRITSRMMLLFTWTLQSLFSRVRSFIFVSELGEVTRHFKDLKPEEAVDLATSSDVISLTSNSNYGNALSQFALGFLGSVSRRTTVMVIGDGRNNFNAANVWALEDIRRKARRVLWIATEPATNWGFGDSEMLAYSRAVSQVVVVRTLRDLERVAAELARGVG